MRLTRRELAAVVSGTAAAAITVPTSAQTAAQTPAQTEQRPDDLQAARDRIKANGDLLAQQKVPMATEPSFQFKA